MKQFNIPKDVSFIINEIIKADEEAYIVGGCVRDLLLGVEPADWDITTSATPEKVKSLFKRTIDTGLAHGTVTVLLNKVGYEVTTYRIEGKYEDHRRPSEVFFTRTLSEDLLRRDFTINAMAYNEYDGLIDLYNGKEDLQAKLIRCVGNANERFSEDALRMLRAIRFSAKLGFMIEEDTYKAITKLKELIAHVSAERINVELTKTLMSKEPAKVSELVKTGLIEYIMPEFTSIVGMEQNNPFHVYTVDEHTYKTLEAIEAEQALRWTMYLHDIGKGYTKTTDEEGVDHFYGHPKVSEEKAKVILKRLKFDNKTIDRVTKLIRHHDDRFVISKKSVRKSLSKIGIYYYDDFLKVKKADALGQNPDFFSKRIEELEEVEGLYRAVLEDKECFSVKDLALNGHDLKKLGVTNGKEIGLYLKKLLELVIEEPELNTYDRLAEKVKEFNG